MRAQGLPINFIVLAALAILILILAAGFVIAGGSSVTGAMGPQQVQNTCRGYCTTMANDLSNDNSPIGTPVLTSYKYCTATFDITGVGTGKNCDDMGIKCTVTYADGVTKTYSSGTDPCATP